MANVHTDFMVQGETLFVQQDKHPLRVLVSSTVYRKDCLIAFTHC